MKLSGRGDEFDQLAETINDMLDRIGRLMDGVRQVSNAIAHDLRTPITRARTRLEDAALHAQSPDELRAAIERATADLDGIVAVFQALLRIAEIEAGSRRSAFAGSTSRRCWPTSPSCMARWRRSGHVSLVVEAPDHLPAYGDRDLVQQAVANLVDNAVKFSPPGGAVRLRAAATPGRAWRSAWPTRGPGIPAADRAARHRALLPRRGRAQHARGRPGPGAGAGGGAAASGHAAAGRCGAGPTGGSDFACAGGSVRRGHALDSPGAFDAAEAGGAAASRGERYKAI